ncbi:MAG: hypothetical protein HYV28_11275, partial [Ignavibacteriales bacterium]|nr:hypothetical protein [Ignavibacteriales bacterium]
MNFLIFLYSLSCHFLPKGVREEKPKIFSTAIVLVLSMNNTMLPQENSHGHLNDTLPKEIRSYIDLLSSAMKTQGLTAQQAAEQIAGFGNISDKTGFSIDKV